MISDARAKVTRGVLADLVSKFDQFTDSDGEASSQNVENQAAFAVAFFTRALSDMSPSDLRQSILKLPERDK
ncbi:MAG TPA: hypothetical protein VGC58_01810 [Candidatus Paceibacterota bacterium]